MHETLQKFGYPHTCIKEYAHWAVLLRPQQITLGSCVIVIKEDVRSVGIVSASSFAEFSQVVQQLETTLGAAFQYDKINYLALMMVDPQVHYHVLPRYAQPRDFAHHHFIDSGWPQLPAMADRQNLNDEQLGVIQQEIIRHYPS